MIKKFLSRKLVLVFVITAIVWSVFWFVPSEGLKQTLIVGWFSIVGGYLGVNGLQHIGIGFANRNRWNGE